MSDKRPITKDWLESVGFRVIEKPDRRKREQLTKFSRHLPGHLTVRVWYWEWPKCPDTPDASVSCSATYHGGSLPLPSHCTASVEAFCEAVRVLCNVELEETNV